MDSLDLGICSSFMTNWGYSGQDLSSPAGSSSPDGSDPPAAKGKQSLRFIIYPSSVSKDLREMFLLKSHPQHNFQLQNNRSPFKTTCDLLPLYFHIRVPAAFTNHQPFTLGTVSKIFQRSWLRMAEPGLAKEKSSHLIISSTFLCFSVLLSASFPVSVCPSLFPPLFMTFFYKRPHGTG